MALEDKVQALIDLLTEQAKSTAEAKAEQNSTKPAGNKEVTLNELKQKAKEFETISQSIKEKYNNISNVTDEIIDKEEILKKIKEEEISTYEKEFEYQQNIILQLENEKKIKNGLSAVDQQALDDARERAKILKGYLEDNQKQIEQEKKIAEQKEKIKIIGKEILANAKKYSLEIEQHLINIGKLTGGVQYFGEASKATGNVFAATIGAGITGEQGMKAMQTLNAEFINSITFGNKAVGQMSLVTAQLEKVGVSGATAAKNFDTLVNAMGRTPLQAGKIQESFVQMAAKNKLALNSVTEAFSANSSRFVGYGEQMTKVLDGLAEQALQTGIQINNLVQIASGFDTFEDAATKVGNLNTLLGGDYFNSIELLTATDEERIKLLKEGVLASGMQWESMNRFQKMAIANSAGIKDLNEAAKLFGSNLTGVTKQQADAAETQKTLAQQAAAASTIMDKLTSTLNGLLLAIKPIVEVAMMVSTALSSLVNKATEAGGAVAGFIVSLVALTVFLAGSVGPIFLLNKLGGGLVFLLSKIPLFGAAIQTTAGQAATSGSLLVKVILALGRAGTSGAVGLFAIGAAAIGIGAGIALAAAGLGYLVKSFEGLGWASIPAAIGIIGVTLALASLITTLVAFVAGPQALFTAAAISALWAIGAAIALIGAGIGMAVAGFGYMIGNISALVNSLSKIDSQKFDNLFALFSDDNIKKVNVFAEAISKLNEPFIQLNNNLSSIVANLERMGLDMKAEMSVATAVPEKITAAISATTITAAGTTAAATTQTLIPAQQTSYVVPMVVNIGKDKIIEILKGDMEKIARMQATGEANKLIDALGVVSSADGIQLRNVVG